MASHYENFPAKFALNNNIDMPSIGLGTYRIRQADAMMNAVDVALGAGYRLFDTAAVYGNEVHLGKALKELLPKYGLERQDIFITSKISPADQGVEKSVTDGLNKSIKNLNVDYLDLYLIHFPGTAKVPANDERNSKLRQATWASFVKLYDEGLVSAIGVSNFTTRHLKELQNWCHESVPTVNQVEWHPFYHQDELLMYCKKNEIVLQAYSSFGGSSRGNNDLLQDPIVTKIARKYDVSSAQVLLIWALQQDVAVIPKSTHPDRIKENISLNIKLKNEEMKALDDLGQRNIKYSWDPTNVA